jgi:large subunit ribosomal protein L30
MIPMANTAKTGKTGETTNTAKTPSAPATPSAASAPRAARQPNEAKTAKTAPTGKLRITYVKSVIGYNQKQRDTIKALGLRRLHQAVEHTDTPEIRGMVNKVSHLVRVEEVAG